MFRHLSLAAIVLLLGVLAAGPAEAQEMQRGTLKKLDIENHTVVVTVGGTDHELTLTDDTQVPGGQGKNLAEKFRAFREGSDVVFKALARDGKQIVQGIRPAEAAKGAQDRAGRGGDGAQRGKVKEVDAAGRTIVLTVDEKDVALAVTEQSDIRGARGETLAERLKGLKPGTDVMFLAADRDGRKMLLGLTPAGAVRGSTNAGGRADQTAMPDVASLKPLNDLGIGKYQGYTGGLYPDGRNARPKEHEAAGLKLAARIQPLDSEGRPDPAGKIVLLSIGMSNTSAASQGFERALTGHDRKNPRVSFVNGAQDGMPAATIQNPDDGDRGTLYWTVLDQRLEQAGATRAQVQAIWIKQANYGPRAPFPAYAGQLQSDLMRIVQIVPRRFPNAKLIYLSSRSYSGDATTPINPEPFAYESAFAVKWLIEEQLKHNPALNFDASKGAVTSPWLSWGPYWWANGQSKRSADGFSWERADFARDGLHLSAAGQRKIGLILLEFFKTDSTTRGWFNQRQADGLSSSKQTRQLLQPVAA